MLREGLQLRFWIDQRRGWRFTNPNLEQLGLVRAEYQYIEDLARDDEEFAASPILRSASAVERQAALQELLDHMRKGLAVNTAALGRQKADAIAQTMRGADQGALVARGRGHGRRVCPYARTAEASKDRPTGRGAPGARHAPKRSRKENPRDPVRRQTTERRGCSGCPEDVAERGEELRHRRRGFFAGQRHGLAAHCQDHPIPLADWPTGRGSDEQLLCRPLHIRIRCARSGRGTPLRARGTRAHGASRERTPGATRVSVQVRRGRPKEAR